MFEFYKKSTELYNSTFELQQKQAKILSGKVPVNMPPPPSSPASITDQNQNGVSK